MILEGKETILDDNYKLRTKRRYLELLELLNKKYGKNNYPHEFLKNQAVSWFNGPIEIEASYNELYGIRMNYKDLRSYSKYLNEYVEHIRTEDANEETRKAKEAEKL